MATPPDADDPSGREAATNADVPPFWTWRAIYAVVLGALALQVVVYAVLSRVLR
jgi:hypothetical protein